MNIRVTVGMNVFLNNAFDLYVTCNANCIGLNLMESNFFFENTRFLRKPGLACPADQVTENKEIASTNLIFTRTIFSPLN